MSSKKKRRSIIDDLFGGSLFDETDETMGSGYTMSVTQTPEGTEVHAKVSKDTDVGELRRQLQQQYPGAKIEIEGGKPLIREISTRTIEEETDRKDRYED